MNHDSAINSEAAERYMLAEMTEAERAEFEDHSFDCTVCTANVQSIEKLRDVIRTDPDEVQPVPAPVLQPTPAPAQWWQRATVALPWAATFILGAWIWFAPGHQSPLPSYGVISNQLDIRSSVRAGDEGPQTVLAGHAALLNVEIEHDPQFTSYYTVVRDRSGEAIQQDAVTIKQASNPVVVLLRPLPAGSYETVIEGVRKDGNRSEITRRPFVVVEDSPGS
jgi:hypothetical protein